MRSRKFNAALVCATLSVLASCGPERPPQAKDGPQGAGVAVAEGETPAGDKAGTPGPAQLLRAQLEGGALLTYAGAKGAFFDAQSIEDVPENARGFVRVVVADGAKAPAGKVWVANLSDDAAEAWPLKPVARDMFEEYALGQGRSSEVDVASLPEGLVPPDPSAAPAKLIVYKTTWCGVCKKLKKYLDRKGVDYELKDVEKDPGAAAELKAFAASKGGWKGSVPVVVMGDEMMVGFDRARLEKML